MSRLSRRQWIASAATLSTARLLRSASRNTAHAYVGSFSFESGPEGNRGNGKGIYLFEVDLETGALRQLEVAEDGFNPW